MQRVTITDHMFWKLCCVTECKYCRTGDNARRLDPVSFNSRKTISVEYQLEMMENTSDVSLDEAKDVVDDKETKETELENTEDGRNGFVGLFDQNLSLSDRTPGVCSFMNTKPTLYPSSTRHESLTNRGPGERCNPVDQKEPGSEHDVTQGLHTNPCEGGDNGDTESGGEENKQVMASESERGEAPRVIGSMKERWRMGENVLAAKNEGKVKMERKHRRRLPGQLRRMEEEEGEQDEEVLNEWCEKSGVAEPAKDQEMELGRIGDGGVDREDTDGTVLEGNHVGDRKKGGMESSSSLSSEGSCESPWPSSPQPVLSRMLLHSSASSTPSSFNGSSADSDEVFSEEEGTASRRKTLQRCHSWRTFLTVMQWSLRRQSSWVQLAGHQGNFQLSEGGEVLKRFSEVEAVCLQALMDDPLRPFVPQYYGSVARGGHSYIRLEDLLSGLKSPVIMDCKMGIRTYLEEELTKAQSTPTLRTDMYMKMVKVDPTAPTVEEHEQQGVTKWRYMQWRDTNCSTSTLGFRIEGIMLENGSVQRDFRKTLSDVQVTEALLFFTKSQINILKAYHYRLKCLAEALQISPFFKAHEVIGSSLLFVHDRTSKASIWMIDFGKTTPVPKCMQLRHNVPWALGNREDGYLLGLAALTSFVGQAIDQATCRQENNNEIETTDTNSWKK
ncbi:hypothetical protein UPYG_G00212470 [Umbra pygmaea]|uniref:Kinase n=1 Tax=Umbra pygmaea TaxID=75934 RepID=A0ABD0WQA5_UMBPY